MVPTHDAAGQATTTATAPEKPNLVLVLTDDQSMDTMLAMPFLESRPDGHWIEFSEAHFSTPLCCPSRATILSGQYSWHHGVLDNHRSASFDDTETVATWLDAAGYRTAHIGKYLNGYPFGRGDSYTPPGWDEWVAFLGSEVGYNDYSLNENGTVVPYGSSTADYSTDVLRDHALDFVNDASPDPFFLHFAPYAPHAPRTPPDRHLSTYDETPVPRSPNVFESDVSDKPAWVQALPPLSAIGEQRREQRMRDAFGTVRAVDEAIEQLFDALRSRGELDNTVFIFMTDNGFSYRSHRHEGKLCVYEECINTPLLIRYPWADARVESALVSNIDLAPTLAQLGGTSPSIAQDGQSLVPLIEGTAPEWPDQLYLGLAGGHPIPDYWAIRTSTHKYVELATGELELYDLVADPLELDNVAGQAAYAEIQAELAYELDRLDLIELTLTPSTVPADGISTSEAKVRIRHADGVPESDESVEITTSGDVSISPVVDNGDGTYTATVTASTTPGDETITATMGPVSAAAVATETPTLVVSSVSPDSAPPGSGRVDVTITGDGFESGATASFGQRIRVRRVRFLDTQTLLVTIMVRSRTAPGPRTVTVTVPSGASGNCIDCFQITSPP